MYLDHRGGTNPVPWDGFAQQRMGARSQRARRSHGFGAEWFASIESGSDAAVDRRRAGWFNFGVRDINGGIPNHPEYTQERYVDAVVDGVARWSPRFLTTPISWHSSDSATASRARPVDEQIIANSHHSPPDGASRSSTSSSRISPTMGQFHCPRATAPATISSIGST